MNIFFKRLCINTIFFVIMAVIAPATGYAKLPIARMDISANQGGMIFTDVSVIGKKYGGEYGFATWRKNKDYIVASFQKTPADEWARIGVKFTPTKSGTVKISLLSYGYYQRGCDGARAENGAAPVVFYDDVTAKGAVLENGGFEEVCPDTGNPVSWTRQVIGPSKLDAIIIDDKQYVRSGKKSALALHNSRYVQTIEVKQNVPVTIEGFAYCEDHNASLHSLGYIATKPVRISYDRDSCAFQLEPSGKLRFASRWNKWFLDVNRLTYSGFPIFGSTAGITKNKLDKSDCVLLLGGGKSMSGKAVESLISYVSRGGGLIVYGDINPALEKILPVQINTPGLLTVKDVNDSGFGFRLKKGKSPLTDLFRNNQTSLPIPNRGSIFSVTVKKDAKVLAEFVDSQTRIYPALVTGKYGKGRVVYFAGTLDRIYPTRGHIKPALDQLWTYHPLWDATQLVWIGYASRREDFRRLVVDYQRYLTLRTVLFNRIANMLQVNDVLRINDTKQADDDLAKAKSGLWEIASADSQANQLKLVRAYRILAKIEKTLPPHYKTVKGKPSASPADGNFWLAGSMMDITHWIGKHNSVFLDGFFKKYKRELQYDGDSIYMNPGRGFIPPKSVGSDDSIKASDFKPGQWITLDSMKKNSLSTIPAIMQSLNLPPEYTRKNAKFQAAKKDAMGFHSPKFERWLKPWYKAFGRYCDKENSIVGVEYLNEPCSVLFRYNSKRDKNLAKKASRAFRQWLKQTYGDPASFSRTFSVSLKSWDDIPSPWEVRKRLMQNVQAGKRLSTEDGILWQLCPRSDVPDYRQIKESEWKQIKVPGFFQTLLGPKNGKYWYRTRLAITPEMSEGFSLRFTAVDDDTRVFVKGQMIKKNVGFNTPFSAVVTADIIGGAKELYLYVEVDDTRGNGGIYRPVYMAPLSQSWVKLKPQAGNDRLIWGLYGRFAGEYTVKACRRYVRWLREETKKPMIDRTLGSPFDTAFIYEQHSQIPDVFGPHVTNSMTYDYVEGLNRAAHKIVSEYYFIAYGERDPVTGKTPKAGRFLGSFYRKHPRAEYRASGRARNQFWEMAARGFNGIECFAPATFRWNPHTLSIPPRTSWMTLYWAYYNVRYEPRIPILVTAHSAWEYKNMYEYVKGSQPDHRLYILVSQASIRQSQFGSLNTMHPVKTNAYALHNFLTRDLRQQVGFVDTDRFVREWVKKPQARKILFIVSGMYLEEKLIDALRKFMEQGGTVVAFGPTAVYDAYGRWLNDKSATVTGNTASYAVSGGKAHWQGKTLDLPQRKGSTHLFRTDEKAISLVDGSAGNSTGSLIYKKSCGKGNYYQFGISPQDFRLAEGYSNVDEALLALDRILVTPKDGLKRLAGSLIGKLVRDAKAESDFSTPSKTGKIIVRNHDKYQLLFVFNTDLLDAEDIQVTFPAKRKVFVICGKGREELGIMDKWTGSISPGGCRLLQLYK